MRGACFSLAREHSVAVRQLCVECVEGFICFELALGFNGKLDAILLRLLLFLKSSEGAFGFFVIHIVSFFIEAGGGIEPRMTNVSILRVKDLRNRQEPKDYPL